MRNKKLIPFETIEKAVAGEPEAIDAVLRHYAGRIKYLSTYYGHINADIQDRLKAQLIKAILQLHYTMRMLENCHNQRIRCLRFFQKTIKISNMIVVHIWQRIRVFMNLG